MPLAASTQPIQSHDKRYNYGDAYLYWNAHSDIRYRGVARSPHSMATKPLVHPRATPQKNGRLGRGSPVSLAKDAAAYRRPKSVPQAELAAGTCAAGVHEQLRAVLAAPSGDRPIAGARSSTVREANRPTSSRQLPGIPKASGNLHHSTADDQQCGVIGVRISDATRSKGEHCDVKRGPQKWKELPRYRGVVSCSCLLS